MAHLTYNDLRPFFEAHPVEGETQAVHKVHIASGAQVSLICMTCGFSVTQDAVDAGLPVIHEQEKK